MVLDTDTANEIDDQFAVAHALLSGERLGLEAIYAAPFARGGCGPAAGVAESEAEILRADGAARGESRGAGAAWRGSVPAIGE